MICVHLTFIFLELLIIYKHMRFKMENEIIWQVYFVGIYVLKAYFLYLLCLWLVYMFVWNV